MDYQNFQPCSDTSGPARAIADIGANVSGTRGLDWCAIGSIAPAPLFASLLRVRG
jgi:hypothetical protein